MNIDRKVIKENFINELYAHDIDNASLDIFVDELCNLSEEVVTSLDKKETAYLRKRIGVYDNGKVQSYRVVASCYNNLAQNVCTTIHKACNNIVRRIKTGKTNIVDNRTKMSSLSISKDFYDTDITKLNLNSRIRRVLNNKVTTIYDLLSYSYDDLIGMGLGPDSIKTLYDVLHSYGLKPIDELTIEERKIVISMSTLEMIDNSSIGWISGIKKAQTKWDNRTIGELKAFYMETGELDDEALSYADSIGIHLGKFKMTIEDINNSYMSLYEILKISLKNIQMSVRLYHSLRRYGINTIGDVVNNTKMKLRSIKGINDTGMNELTNLIHSLGLVFIDEKTKSYIYARKIYKKLDYFSSLEEVKKQELIDRYNDLSKIKAGLEDVSAEINKAVMAELKEEYESKKVKKI